MKARTPDNHITPTLKSILHALRKTIDITQHSIETSKLARDSIKTLQTTNLEQERNKLLKPIQDELHRANLDLESARNDGIKTLFKQQSLKRKISTLKSDLNTVKKSDAYSHTTLTKKTDEHNLAAIAAHEKKSRLTAEIANHTARLKHCQDVESALTELYNTALKDGWICSSCAPCLHSICTHLNSSEYSKAAELTSRLVYQKVPHESQWSEWESDAQSILETAHRDAMAGFIPLTAFEPIADRACELTRPWCNEATRQITLHSVPVDRWHQLVGLMQKPRNLVHPLHWALYWSNFKASQEFASDCMAAAHEESFSGRFLSLINTCAKDWAAPRFGKMGFPVAKVLLGTLSLGGLKAESRLGADLGIIIDIDVGGLSVRKVALLQAKKSCNGIADVGSLPTGPAKQTQLQKLNDAARDFYLFYHHANTHAAWPGPTVVAAINIAGSLPNLAAGSISIDTRAGGWDWASFVAFGLCAPDSGVGRQLSEGEDALSVLGSGDRRSLPENLLVVSISGSDFSLKLRLEIQQHYKELGTSYPTPQSSNRNTLSFN